jgi:predicted metal-dependent peptidase
MAKKISNERLEELKYNARGILANARRNLLAKYPFIGTVAMSLDIVPVRDANLETAATDGKNIFFDIDFLSKLTQNQILFVIAHEVMHCVLMHLTRSKSLTNKHICNIAADFEVNSMLVCDSFDHLPSALLPTGSGFSFPWHLNMERYYDLLMEEANNNNAWWAKTFDKHIFDENDINDLTKTDSSRKDRYGEVGKDADLKPSNSVKDVNYNQNMIEKIINAAQIVERQRGTLPSYAKRLINNILNPEVPWQEVLANFITSSSGSKHDWSKPKRRYISSGLYLPSTTSESINAAVIIDTSASTANLLDTFVTELNSIINLIPNYTLNVIDIDTDIKDVRTFNSENQLKAENFNVTGGGGTILLPAFKYIEEHLHDVDVVIAFTDGYCEEIHETDVPNMPLLWVIAGDNEADNITVGKKINIKEK